MRKLIIGAFAFSFLLFGCKTIEKLKKDDVAETVSQEEPQSKVFSVTEPKPGIRENPTSDKMYEQPSAPVRTQTETFTFAQKEDASKYEGGSFFVIIGSFSSIDNANRYKEELIPQGFNPIVLHSETGYYRVCVNSYTNEGEARNRVNQIRNNFPKYADTWLLIKK